MNWLRTNSLWAAALGLMIASSGLDGAWLAKMMPARLEWMGYVLNTTSDVAGLILMYWFGVFRQSPKNSKRYKLALALLPAELVAVGYSWYFGYLQLLLVLPAVMGADAGGVALVSAGFIPLLLAFIGFAQSLLAGKWEKPSSGQVSAAEEPVEWPALLKAESIALETKPAVRVAPEPEPAVLDTEPAEIIACQQCGKEFGSSQALNAHKRWCKGESK